MILPERSMGKRSPQATFDQSLRNPAGFWGEAAESICWYRKWEKVLDDSRRPFYRWFVGGELNTCYNALDLHVEEGRGDQPALIYDSPVTNTIKVLTYRELRDKVAAFAGYSHALRGLNSWAKTLAPCVPIWLHTFRERRTA
jgi:propionyl-CoA synthetase